MTTKSKRAKTVRRKRVREENRRRVSAARAEMKRAIHWMDAASEMLSPAGDDPVVNDLIGVMAFVVGQAEGLSLLMKEAAE